MSMKGWIVMSPISSGATMGKMYADALKIEEKYESLKYELKHIIEEADPSRHGSHLITLIEELLRKHE